MATATVQPAPMTTTAPVKPTKAQRAVVREIRLWRDAFMKHGTDPISALCGAALQVLTDEEHKRRCYAYQTDWLNPLQVRVEEVA